MLSQATWMKRLDFYYFGPNGYTFLKAPWQLNLVCIFIFILKKKLQYNYWKVMINFNTHSKGPLCNMYQVTTPMLWTWTVSEKREFIFVNHCQNTCYFLGVKCLILEILTYKFTCFCFLRRHNIAIYEWF